MSLFCRQIRWLDLSYELATWLELTVPIRPSLYDAESVTVPAGSEDYKW